MKPIEQFIGQMMESARRVQARDPAAATDIIQQALAQAGLLASQATAQATAKAGAAPAHPDFIDLNTAPIWSKSRMRARPQPRPAAKAQNLPGSFIAGSHTCDAGTRRYKLYIPAQKPEGPRALVVMLHGCTQNPDDFAIGTGMNALAEESGCLVLYPEQDASANHNRCWNWFEPGHQQRDGGEPAILAGLTRRIADEYGSAPGQVFVAGMSAGGAMAAVLGAEYPELFAAIGVHSGLPAGSGRDMITGLQAMKKPARGRTLRDAVPLMVIHGDADHVVAPANGEAVIRQFVGAHAGLHATPLERSQAESNEGGRSSTRTTWRDAQGRAMAEHVVVHGAGHTWSGGNAAGSHTDALGPNASRELLRFFLQTPGSR